MMKKLVGCLFVLGYLGMAAAQAQQPQMDQPPKVLLIVREYLKPGKNGAAHEKTEGAFVQAMARAKAPTHYFAMNSLSGKTRALFFVPYDSFDAWEKDMHWAEKSPGLGAALDRANEADGALLDSTDQGVFVFSEEYSLRPGVDLQQMRYFEIEYFKIRPGHHAEWDEAVKMVKAAYEKAIPDAHWATFEEVMGGSDVYIAITPMASLREIDNELMSNKQFMAAMGPEGMKKLGSLTAACIESSTDNLFMVSPKMSYAREEWIKADPKFWKPKAEAAPVKKMEKMEEKPKAQ